MANDTPAEHFVELGAGAFRTLEWPETKAPTSKHSPVALFLHGLSGVADVWTDTVGALGNERPRSIAVDQRGHGRSPRTPGAYAAVDLVRDAIELITTIGAPIDLVGHSMGARVAILLAARHPTLVRSVSIVDIGPESWRANINATVTMFASLPERFATRDEALEFGRISNRGEEWAQRFVDWRLHKESDGTYTFLASRDALIACVSAQRARNYWSDWERINVPALLVRGATSNEVRPAIADAMRQRNPSVQFVEIPETGHNIPLLAPNELAHHLAHFWERTR